MKKENLLLFFTGFLLFIIIFSFIPYNLDFKNTNYNKNNNIKLSSSLEGIEGVVITKVNRKVNVSGYGLLIFEDLLEIKNLNNNPISSIFFGIPLNVYEEMVFFEALGIDQNTLLTERSNMIMKELEMITIYFSSPLLPHQTETIIINHIYKDLISYRVFDDQVMTFSVSIYPLMPYKFEGDLQTTFFYPKDAFNVEGGWGFVDATRYLIAFSFDAIKDEIGYDYISPFLENLGDKKSSVIFYAENTMTKIEMNKINREIFISPWGILRVREEFSIKNLGEIDSYTFSLKVPQDAKNLYISDYLGKILGVTIETPGISRYKRVNINLLENRVRLTPNSSFTFNIEYNLPFESYVSLDWFQQSINIDLLTTIYEYLGRTQKTTIIIEGCYNIKSITDLPESIKRSQDSLIIIYDSDFVTPLDKKLVQITYTLNSFDLLLRPIIFILIITMIASLFVIIIKSRKKERVLTAIETEFIPINEIREFCSLTEEKNALILEIRQAEEDSKRKKMVKKKYKNILNKNTSKTEEIQEEILPFKKILMDSSEIFENIIKKLDVLEAERTSVQDSLSLLESRYKRGRLPSRAAFIKLSDDFKKRRKKIDRTLDRLIQQLRSYLL